MADLKAKTQNALDEGRTLILGAQILLGALGRTVFEPGYQKLPSDAKYLVIAALGLITIAIAVLITPAPYHRIAEEGRDTEHFNNFVMKVMYVGLIPFALSLGIAIYIGTFIVTKSWLSAFAGGLTVAVCLFFWYAMGSTHSAEKHNTG